MDALTKRHERAIQHNEFLFAQLTAWVVNRPSIKLEELKPTTDFMPSEHLKKKRQPMSDEPTEDERRMIANQMRGVMEALMKRGGN